MSDLDDVFKIMNEVYSLNEKIKNSFDLEQNEKDLVRISILRDTMLQILKDNGIEEDENN